MKKVFKIGCGGIIALIILVIVIAAMSGGDEDATPNDNSSSNDTSAPKTEKQDVGIGTPLEIGGAAFTLNGVELADQVGPTVLPTKSSVK